MISDLTCVILAGGLGKRLRSVIKDIPKPMALVKGRPFLEYLLLQVKPFGIKDVVLCVGYKSEIIEQHFGDGKALGMSIRYSREKELLGTAGALAKAKDMIISEPFLALNGDSFCEVDFSKLIGSHLEHVALATIVSPWVGSRSQSASIIFDKGLEIKSFSEKQGNNEPGYINGGIYVLSKKIFDYIPSGKPCSIEYEVLPMLTGKKIYAFPASGLFIDIGNPSDLERAQKLLNINS